MTIKKMRRVAGTNNGARRTKHIISLRRLRNKCHVALMRGSVAGAFAAVVIGTLHMETAILEGALIACTGIAWMLGFYILNPTDRIFDGGENDE